MRTDITIEIVVLIEKTTGRNKVVYLSNAVQGDQGMDLYVSERNKLIALYHQHAYENDTLKARRNQHDMLYPGSTDERMIFVGHLLGALQYDPHMHIEVSRAQLHLKNIPVDEV